jgi:SAM-dependent methyltransferase
MRSPHPPKPTHSHMWLVGVIGLVAGLTLMLYVPSLKAISASLTLLAAFHLVGAVVASVSLYLALGKQSPWQRKADALDFGWTPAWTLGPLLAAVVFLATAVVIQLAAPNWWPLSMVATLLAGNAFAGHLLTWSASRPEHASLPWVNLLPDGSGQLLDGGCGAGRTSIAMARALPRAQLVALDKFDADYIDQGGRALLDRNLQLAGLSDQIKAQAGDLTAMPFPEGSFDAAVSAHAMDHLGAAKEQGLREMLRVLKPGGRFLLIVWVPGWAMFAVANVLSFGLAGPSQWRDMARQVGFEMHEEGHINGHWYIVLGKPAR